MLLSESICNIVVGLTLAPFQISLTYQDSLPRFTRWVRQVAAEGLRLSCKDWMLHMHVSLTSTVLRHVRRITDLQL